MANVVRIKKEDRRESRPFPSQVIIACLVYCPDNYLSGTIRPVPGISGKGQSLFLFFGLSLNHIPEMFMYDWVEKSSRLLVYPVEGI